MDFCILTVIKDEQDYLDDFIKYHTNLGINHFFIFEDVGSTSHKCITNKYNNVSLFSVDILFQDKENTHKQGEYFIYGLLYLKEQYNYDWCFAIDVDEYITIENENDTLQDVMKQYNDYEALVLQWQNYGANGLIYKPDYNGRSITEIYTKKTCMAKRDVLTTLTTKVAYRLPVFKREYFFTHHIPSSICKWCRPNFEKIKKKPIYDKIYIRHYITKSLEEYIWKLDIRGLFSQKRHRTYSEFFYLNPDIDEKELYRFVPKEMEITS